MWCGVWKGRRRGSQTQEVAAACLSLFSGANVQFVLSAAAGQACCGGRKRLHGKKSAREEVLEADLNGGFESGGANRAVISTSSRRRNPVRRRSALTIVNSTLSNNRAEKDAGGAVDLRSGALTMQGCLVSGNQAGDGGGLSVSTYDGGSQVMSLPPEGGQNSAGNRWSPRQFFESHRGKPVKSYT